MNAQVFHRFDEANARIDSIVLVGAALSSDGAPTGPLRDLLEDAEQFELEELFGTFPQYAIDAYEDQDVEALGSWLIEEGKLGFLVHFEAASMTWHDDRSASVHWGSYYTRWFYAETLEQAIERGFAWVAGCRDREKAARKARGSRGKRS